VYLSVIEGGMEGCNRGCSRGVQYLPALPAYHLAKRVWRSHPIPWMGAPPSLLLSHHTSTHMAASHPSHLCVRARHATAGGVGEVS